ncbi:MAG: hypothetical protein AAF353_03520, partial [Pseudomonadota bacterium]
DVRVRIIAVGKAKDRGLQGLLSDYYARIDRYAIYDCLCGWPSDIDIRQFQSRHRNAEFAF